MKIIKIYKNGTIRLPQDIVNKLKLQHDDMLVIECRHNGFVVCKLGYYQDWLDKLDQELIELDAYSRQYFTRSMSIINKKPIQSNEDVIK